MYVHMYLASTYIIVQYYNNIVCGPEAKCTIIKPGCRYMCIYIFMCVQATLCDFSSQWYFCWVQRLEVWGWTWLEHLDSFSMTLTGTLPMTYRSTLPPYHHVTYNLPPCDEHVHVYTSLMLNTVVTLFPERWSWVNEMIYCTCTMYMYNVHVQCICMCMYIQCTCTCT